MILVEGKNVNDLLIKACREIWEKGVEVETRIGKAIRFPLPVTLWYKMPQEKVLFNPLRDANPFFHFIEALWMLAGRNDVHSVSKYVKRMNEFSDDGTTFHGAYGYRWRKAFEMDQVVEIIQSLSHDINSRRLVLQMWDARMDLGKQGKDFPCNTHAYFSVLEGELNMTVCNRSNDLIWGALGANAVHFSMLQQFIAEALGLHVGDYHQVSNNMHLYEHHYELAKELIKDFPGTTQTYPTNHKLCSMLRKPSDWPMFLEQAEMFFEDYTAMGNWLPFFRSVAMPIASSWAIYRNKELSPRGRCEKAISELDNCAAADWKAGCVLWLTRRLERV